MNKFPSVVLVLLFINLEAVDSDSQQVNNKGIRHSKSSAHLRDTCVSAPVGVGIPIRYIKTFCFKKIFHIVLSHSGC